jgi:hypothetical protein
VNSLVCPRPSTNCLDKILLHRCSGRVCSACVPQLVTAPANSCARRRWNSCLKQRTPTWLQQPRVSRSASTLPLVAAPIRLAGLLHPRAASVQFSSRSRPSRSPALSQRESPEDKQLGIFYGLRELYHSSPGSRLPWSWFPPGSNIDGRLVSMAAPYAA